MSSSKIKKRSKTPASLFNSALRFHKGKGATRDLVRAKSLYERAVDGGHVGAMYNLGNLLKHGGVGVPKDAPAAKALFEQAMGAGHVRAIYNLGRLLKNGDIGVPKDAPAAKALFERAVDDGHVNAMYNLGRLLRNGDVGVPKDAPAAKAMFERAVDAGDVDAMYNLGRLLRDGDVGVPKDAPAAKAMFERAVDAGHVDAMYNLGLLLNDGGVGVPKDAPAAKILYKRAVDAGHVNAMNNLGFLLRDGDVGVPKDAPAAKELYEQAADAGNVNAMNNLGNLLKGGGVGVPKDAPAAKAMYERAVDAGDVIAMFNLGLLLHEGDVGVPKDAPTAKAMYERAMGAGNVRAMTNLGILLRTGGANVPKDVRRAKALLERAADSGHAYALYRLSAIVAGDNGDVPADFIWSRSICAARAKMLFSRAADAGNVRAMYYLANMLRDGRDGIAKDLKRAHELYRRAASAGNENARIALSTPSSLEKAFGVVLSDSSILDERFLLASIRMENVNTSSDLLCGHNIVLLSIRAGAITCDNIRSLGGSNWYLQDNLYLPGSKLTGEDSMVVDAVFQHAENLGIIRSGYALKVAREIRTDLKKDARKMGRIIEEVAGRVLFVEKRVSSLENRASAVEGNAQELHSAFERMSLNQGKLKDAVPRLSETLTDLQKLIRKQNRRMTYAGVARCILSFIPLVGSAVGNAAYTATDVLLGLTAEELMPAGVGALKSLVSQMACVDLSNFQVARYAFSDECIGQLDTNAKSAVVQAVGSSGFKNLKDLQQALENQIKSTGYADLSTALVNMGSCSWLSGNEEKRGASSSSSNQTHALDDKARNYFKALPSTDENGELDIEEAKIELNQFLEKCEGLCEVSGEKLEDLFFEVADEDAAEVNEEIFVGMFRAIRDAQEKQKVEERLREECLEWFRKKAGKKKVLSIRMAARVLRGLPKNVKGLGMEENGGATMTDLQAKKVLKRVDEDANGTISEEEFVKAVRVLF